MLNFSECCTDSEASGSSFLTGNGYVLSSLSQPVGAQVAAWTFFNANNIYDCNLMQPGVLH